MYLNQWSFIQWFIVNNFYFPLKILVKVSKFQKQIFLFSFEPKTEQNYLLISALRMKNESIKKINASI